VTQLLASEWGPTRLGVGRRAVRVGPTSRRCGRFAQGKGSTRSSIAAMGGGSLGARPRGFRSLAPGVLAHALFDGAVIMMFPSGV